ncbi:hypothetical protein AcV5_002549 [Taiwanofungus camphoratus]|nr:hypothetical protein AcV5_002549 [Antrodia cinnamomea]
MLSLYLSLALLPSFSFAFSFNFTSIPQQCQELSLAISGSGKPPYSVLIIPFGPSPLPNAVEARRIFEVQFNGTSTSASFLLNYPANSQFVAVVSDDTGFGTGGTSVAATVQSSSASSCFNATQNVSPDFDFSIVPANQLVQCTPTRIWWDPSTVQGTPSFQGIIPGGQSFSIPEGNLTTVPEEGLGFDWSPSVRTGTTVLLIGGDNRGMGSGGSGFYIMSQGQSTSCLNSQSPSSTPGSPAGGSYPTSTNGASTNPSTGGGTSSSHTDVGAIVGGVVGGIAGAAVILIACFFIFRRRRETQQAQKERPVDLLQDHEHDNDDGMLPQYYEPDPFLMPEPTILSSSGADEHSVLRPSTDRRQTLLSATSASGLTALRPGTPDYSMRSGTTNTRKTPAPPSLRPVNIVQHEDAGPPEQDAQQEPETIELPPAYTNIRKTSSSLSPPAPGTSDD